MSRLVSRILLSIFMFPLGAILYLMVIVLSDQALRGTSYPSREIEMFFAADVLTWSMVAAYWCLLWRSNVRWNSFRIGGTVLAALCAAIAGTIAGALVATLMGRNDASFGIFVGGVLAMVLWLIATVFIWRETATERAAYLSASGKTAVTCPTCGYNLTGLSESRCPECGSKFTLDELLAMQHLNERDIE